jgi:hypothetical protein
MDKKMCSRYGRQCGRVCWPARTGCSRIGVPVNRRGVREILIPDRVLPELTCLSEGID